MPSREPKKYTKGRPQHHLRNGADFRLKKTCGHLAKKLIPPKLKVFAAPQALFKGFKGPEILIQFLIFKPTQKFPETKIFHLKRIFIYF